MVSRRRTITAASSPRRSTDTIVRSTRCELTARKPSRRRRSSSGESLGLIDRNNATSLASIARAYVATTCRIAVSSCSADLAAVEGVLVVDGAAAVADSAAAGGLTGAGTLWAAAGGRLAVTGGAGGDMGAAGGTGG